ncbi:MAG: DNA repair exonuclease [archaeon]|nr:DNA repair exonuclease [archaeon]
MKFAHLADSHLGYRQYGLLERENDFYDVFDKCVDKIIEKKCDFVIHAGDLFEVAKPTPKALSRFQKAFLKLKEAGIPVYAIAGNHDSVRRKGSVPPQILFKDLGLKLLSPNHPMDNFNGILICGMPYTPKSNKSTLLEKFKLFEKEADNHIVSILVAHQGIDKYLPFNPELEIGDLPDNFDYYAMGHVHNYINNAYGKGRLVYPGSSEIWKADEVSDYAKKGKGFAIVEIGVGEPVVKRVTVELPRKFIKEYIDYNELDKKLHLIKTSIKSLENKPIVEITVGNGDFNSSEVYEQIMNELEDYALIIRPSFKPNKLAAEEMIVGDTSLGARQSLVQALNEKYKDETIGTFAIELLDSLANDDMEEANLISNNFYKSHFAGENELYKEKLDLNDGEGKIINKTSPEVFEKLAKNNKDDIDSKDLDSEELELFSDSKDLDSEELELFDDSKDDNPDLEKGQTSLFDSAGGA